jgi:hypoxanthine phosphoribosyltransferase
MEACVEPSAEHRAPSTNSPPPRPPFAHPIEAEFARLLDFYQVRWEYEPKSFPLEWGDDGLVKLSFTPDFYLPDQDLFVELTTLSPRLMHRKNRKLRKLRERYPEVRVKLFSLRDVRALLLRKYGGPVGTGVQAFGRSGAQEATTDDGPPTTDAGRRSAGAPPHALTTTPPQRPTARTPARRPGKGG